MKSQIAILLMLATTSLVAQDLVMPGNSAKLNPFSVGAYFSPDVNYRILKSTDDLERTESLIESRNSFEHEKFGYTTGLSIAYKINGHFSIESGVESSDKGYKTKRTELIYVDYIDPRNGTVPSTNDSPVATHARFIYHFQYLGLPLKLNYTAGKGKWKFISSVGFTAEYLVAASTTLILEYDDDSEKRSNEKSDGDYKSFNLSPAVSAGVDYQLNPRMSLRAMPTVRFGVYQIINAPITSYLYSGGLQLGWYMTI